MGELVSLFSVPVGGETVADGETDEFDGGFCTFDELVRWAAGYGVVINVSLEE